MFVFSKLSKRQASVNKEQGTGDSNQQKLNE
jgi:hypothetical protein